MGVAFGRLVPTERFDIFWQTVPPSRTEGNDIQIWDDLSAVAPKQMALECLGVAVFRYDFNKGVYLEVEVVGITASQYQEFFPHHIAAYERLFAGRKE